MKWIAIPFILFMPFMLNAQKDEYHALIGKYHHDSLDAASLPGLAAMAMSYEEKDLAMSIATDYKRNYLEKLPEDSICTRENLQFITMFGQLLNSNDQFFALFCHQPEKVDSIMLNISPMHQDYAGNRIRLIVRKEEIDQKIWDGNRLITKNPKWRKMQSNIAQKYPFIDAENLVIESRLTCYAHQNNWKRYAKEMDIKIKKYPPKTKTEERGNWMGDAWNLNVAAWQVFLNCNNKRVLKKALIWSNLSISLEEPAPNVQYYDTKANLLYRIGRTEEAINVERKAIESGIENAKKRGVDKGDFFDEYTETLNKMKNNLPTWP